MPIARVEFRESYVHLYGPDGGLLCNIATTGQAKDGVLGYTSTAVRIRKGDWFYEYDETGREIMNGLIPTSER